MAPCFSGLILVLYNLQNMLANEGIFQSRPTQPESSWIRILTDNHHDPPSSA